MVTHGDRKAMKAGTLASINEDVIAHVFQEYIKLVTEQPETKQCVSMLLP